MVPAFTVTEVVKPPTRIRASTDVTPPTSTTTGCSVKPANNAYSTSTRYSPAGRCATRNSPLPSVVVRVIAPSATFCTSTTAPTNAAPPPSTTKPLIAPSTELCPHAHLSTVAAAQHHNRQTRTIFLAIA